MTIAGIIASPQDGEWLDRWANTISSGVLGVLVLVTLPFRPFTEDYAREQTPPEIWDTPGFRRTNQVITLVWGGVFVGTAILGAIAASSPSSSDWTNWILPIALIVGGFKFTQRYPEVVRERARSDAGRSHADVPEPPSSASAR
jgi:quinol-cytochrome oxidoreductase complex cytochrome b subunit